MESNTARVGKKIKICYVTSADVMVRFILFNQLKFFKKEGYDVYVVCPRGKWVGDIERAGLKVKIISLKRKISPISDLIALVELFFYFRKNKFDIIDTHAPKAGLIGQLAAKMAGAPIIINTIHGFLFQKKDGWSKRKFYIFINKVAAMCSNLIFFVNREDMKTAAEEKICSPDLIKYFGGAINVNRFNPERFSKEFIENKKKQLKIPEDYRVIGIVARLVAEKGYLDLFEAIKSVLKKFPKTIILSVGPEEPEKKDAISPMFAEKYYIEKNVIFLGEREDVDEIYPVMDVFVLPSHREGLGIAILEASAMEKPVVSTNIRGCREAVDDGKTGILVPEKDPEKLAEALIYFLENPVKAREMGANGRIKVIKEFDENIIFDRIKKEYDYLLSKKLGGGR